VVPLFVYVYQHAGLVDDALRAEEAKQSTELKQVSEVKHATDVKHAALDPLAKGP
jgi:hypothetical protein